MATRANRAGKPIIRRIGISTGGGDAPGLNAVIRAAVKSALNRGWEVVGIRRGFDGLFKPGMAKKLTAKDVAGILTMGGTILGTTNRGNPFEYRTRVGGKTVVKDMSGHVLQSVRKMGLDAIVCIGGDGTLQIARRLADMGVPVVGVPKTIDNDMPGTVVTFGYDTAVSTATDALDKLHSTAGLPSGWPKRSRTGRGGRREASSSVISSVAGIPRPSTGCWGPASGRPPFA